MARKAVALRMRAFQPSRETTAVPQSRDNVSAEDELACDYPNGRAILGDCYFSARQLLGYQGQHDIHNLLRPMLNPVAFEFIEIFLCERKEVFPYVVVHNRVFQLLQPGAQFLGNLFLIHTTDIT